MTGSVLNTIVAGLLAGLFVLAVVAVLAVALSPILLAWGWATGVLSFEFVVVVLLVITAYGSWL